MALGFFFLRPRTAAIMNAEIQPSGMTGPAKETEPTKGIPCPCRLKAADHSRLAPGPRCSARSLTAALLERFGSAGCSSPGKRRRAAIGAAHPEPSWRRSFTRRSGMSMWTPRWRTWPGTRSAWWRRVRPAILQDLQIPSPPPVLYVRGSLAPADARRRTGRLPAMHRLRSPGGRAVGERSGAVRLHGDFRPGSRNRRSSTSRRWRRAGGPSRCWPAVCRRFIRPNTPTWQKKSRLRALLTEAAMRSEPLPGMFPARNRIISGLSRGVVIIEAAEKSGAAHHRPARSRTGAGNLRRSRPD